MCYSTNVHPYLKINTCINFFKIKPEPMFCLYDKINDIAASYLYL